MSGNSENWNRATKTPSCSGRGGTGNNLGSPCSLGNGSNGPSCALSEQIWRSHGCDECLKRQWKRGSREAVRTGRRCKSLTSSRDIQPLPSRPLQSLQSQRVAAQAAEGPELYPGHQSFTRSRHWISPTSEPFYAENQHIHKSQASASIRSVERRYGIKKRASSGLNRGRWCPLIQESQTRSRAPGCCALLESVPECTRASVDSRICTVQHLLDPDLFLSNDSISHEMLHLEGTACRWAWAFPRRSLVRVL